MMEKGGVESGWPRAVRDSNSLLDKHDMFLPGCAVPDFISAVAGGDPIFGDRCPDRFQRMSAPLASSEKQSLYEKGALGGIQPRFISDSPRGSPRPLSPIIMSTRFPRSPGTCNSPQRTTLVAPPVSVPLDRVLAL